MKVCIVGGGNIGTLLAAELAARGVQTTIYTSAPEKWAQSIEVFDAEDHCLFRASGIRITAQLSTISEADQIWITYPAFLFPSISELMLPYTRKGQMILCIPGCGAEFSFEQHIEKGCVLCGLQRVHCITRLKTYGKSVYALGRKKSIQLAAIPSAQAPHYAEILSDLLQMPCQTLSNYLTVSLTPSNSILHTSRIFTMFEDYHPGCYYDHNILFYEEWDDRSSRRLLECDAELQTVCAALTKMDLSGVKSLREHYESNSAEQMTRKIKSIPAFRGLLSPMVSTPEGWIPDYSSRYFTADFPFGLKIMVDIAKIAGVSAPRMNEIWDWYYSVCRSDADPFFQLSAHSVDELYKLYH